MVDFRNLANQKLAEVERPKPLPRGEYIGRIKGVPEWKDSNFKQEDGSPEAKLVFVYELMEPTDSVDRDELEEAGGLKLGNGNFKTVTHEFNTAQGKLPFALRRFIEGFGADSNLSFAEALEEISGQPVIVTIDHQPDKNDPENVYTRVKKAIANV